MTSYLERKKGKRSQMHRIFISLINEHQPLDKKYKLLLRIRDTYRNICVLAEIVFLGSLFRYHFKNHYQV